MLWRPRNKLIYPAGRAPGFDPGHFAINNDRNLPYVFSSIMTTGTGGAISLIDSRPPDEYQAAGFFNVLDSHLGPAQETFNQSTWYNIIWHTSGGSYAALTSLPNGDGTPAGSAETFAMIIRPASFNSENQLLTPHNANIDTNSNHGFNLGSAGNIYINDGNNQITVSSFVLTAGHPYFIAGSRWWTNATNFDTAAYVAVDLSNGQIQSCTATNTTGLYNGGANYRNAFSIGAGWNPHQMVGRYGPIAYFAGKFLSEQKLLEWAKDPWGFWYPENKIQIGPQGLYTQIDETVPDDVDLAQSGGNPTNDIVRFSLSNLPAGKTLAKPVQVRYRYGATGSGPLQLTARLYEGSTLIAQWFHTDATSTLKDATQVLTDTQFAAITNFNNLEIEFEAGAHKLDFHVRSNTMYIGIISP